jgi:hypothetical protein
VLFTDSYFTNPAVKPGTVNTPEIIVTAEFAINKITQAG